MTAIRCLPFDDKFLPSYSRFARSVFGPQAYQASEQFLHWMYRENPCGGDWSRDFRIAVNPDEQVVGCAHKFRLRWRIDGEIRTIPSGNNLMVAPGYRQGTGLRLLSENVEYEDDLLAPGVADPLGKVYRAMGAQTIPATWHRKLLRPVKAAVQLGAAKLFRCQRGARYFAPASKFKTTRFDCEFDVSPSEERISAVAERMNQRYRDCAAPFWDVESVRWRFFHPHGPQHVLVSATAPTTLHSRQEPPDALSNFLIVSLGPRRGVNVGRIVAADVDDLRSLRRLVRAAQWAVRQAGGTMMLAFSADPEFDALFHQLRWQTIPNPPTTYFYHKSRHRKFERCAFLGGAGDLGFEAIRPAA